MKKGLCSLVFMLFVIAANAQESRSAYNFLRVPSSSHVSALGGENISLIADDAASARQNPALYANVNDRTLGLSFMTYPAGGTLFGAQFVKAFGDRHTAAFTAHYMNYGSVDETDESGIASGTFSPKDLVLSAGYSYLMGDYVSGGAQLKMISSSYGDYSSMALAVDLGLNYFDEDHDLSLSLAALNIGRQIKMFDDRREHLPFNLQAGATIGLAQAPIRLSITMTDLTRWKKEDYFTTEDKIGFGKMLLNHFVAGVDILPSKQTYLSVGYNFRRAYELKQAGESHWAGLSVGGGLTLKDFKFGVSFAKYSLSASSLMVNLSYSFPASKKKKNAQTTKSTDTQAEEEE